MANFFVQQDEARRRSKRLVAMFHLVVFFTALITAIFYLCFIQMQGFVMNDTSFAELLFRRDTLLVFGIVYFMVWGVAVIRRMPLKEGGAAIAKIAGGREVTSNTTELNERRLFNVVEEMGIAAGMPIPRVFVLDQELAINAFAAGQTTHDACVAVSKGALERLTREELQGVVAHEFSHILNGDMKLNLHLLGYLYGLTSIADVGRMLMRSSSRRVSSSSSRNRGGEAQLFGLGIFIIGCVGYFFAYLLKAGVSRDRERLADASAVQFTRNPEGIGGALRKIWRDSEPIIAARAPEISHFYFHWPVGFMGLFSTHPPIIERIKALGLEAKRAEGQASAPVTASAPEGAMGFAGGASPKTIIDHDPISVGFAFYLWLEPSPGLGPVDAVLRKNSTLNEEILTDIYQELNRLSDPERFAMLERSIVRLRELSTEAKRTFLAQMKALIEEDQVVSAREFLYYRLLQLELFPVRGAQKMAADKDVWPQVEIVAGYFGRMFARSKEDEFVRVVMGQLGKPVERRRTQKLAEIQQAMSIMGQSRPSFRPKILDAFSEAFDLSHQRRSETDLALRLLALVLEVPKIRG